MLKNKWGALYQKLPPIFKNKYAAVILTFFIWITFFDRDDIITAFRLNYKLYEIEKQKKYYQEELAKTKEFEDAIFSDKKLLEKFAREKFYMKKADEELYVIVEE